MVSVLPALFLAALLAMVVLLYKEEDQWGSKRFFWPALLIKLACALVFVALYRYYFQQGDVLSYHRQAIRLNEIAHTNWGQYLNLLSRHDILPKEPLPPGLFHWGNPSSWLMVKIISGLHLVTQNNLWLTSLAFGLLSFWGMWRLAVSVWAVRPQFGVAALLALFLIPSVSFWTSGICKETLFWAGLGLFLSAVLRIGQAKSRLKEILIGLFGLWLSWQMRYFVVAILLGCLISWGGGVLVTRFIRTKRQSLVFGVAFFVILASGFSVGPLLHPNFSQQELMRVVVKSNHDLLNKASESDRINYDLKPDWESVLENIPTAVIAAFFRPWPWEADNLMKGLAALENGLLTVLLVLAVWSKKHRSRNRKTLEWLQSALWVFVIYTAVFLSLATPVFGSLHRYRSCFLPFYAFLMLLHVPLLRDLFKPAGEKQSSN